MVRASARCRCSGSPPERSDHQRQICKPSKRPKAVALATAIPSKTGKDARKAVFPMTTEEAMALIEGAVDYCTHRSKVLSHAQRNADASAIDHEFEEWLNPRGGVLPLMPCPKPEGS